MARVVIPDPGDVIAGRYRLDEVLGRGGFGMVFKATHLDMNRPVALKTLLPQAALESVEVERFRQEAVLASSL
ncbi:MAG: serine/threonine protein kinase, partial [Myxococcota bacterium]